MVQRTFISLPPKFSDQHFSIFVLSFFFFSAKPFQSKVWMPTTLPQNTLACISQHKDIILHKYNTIMPPDKINDNFCMSCKQSLNIQISLIVPKSYFMVSFSFLFSSSFFPPPSLPRPLLPFLLSFFHFLNQDPIQFHVLWMVISFLFSLQQMPPNPVHFSRR